MKIPSKQTKLQVTKLLTIPFAVKELFLVSGKEEGRMVIVFKNLEGEK